MIALRDMRPADRDMLRRWRTLPDVARFMLTDGEISADEHARWFARIPADPANRYWIITYGGVDVGMACITGIDAANSRCSWGYYIAEAKRRGQGIGSVVWYRLLQYVFGSLGLEKLCSEVLAGNTAVIAMHRSFGFREEGRFRRHVRKAGAWHDVVALAMLREEWEAARPGIEQRLRAKGLIEAPARDHDLDDKGELA